MAYKAFILFVCFSFYLKFPDNYQYSDEVIYWKSLGSYFVNDNFKIFYIDKIIDVPINEKVLICLHGFPTSSYDWSKMWLNLTSSFTRVITLDFLGYGFSDKPNTYEKYSIMKQADLLEILLKDLEISHFHVLAHDVGDTIVQEMLHRQNSNSVKNYKILSVTLLNGGIFVQTNFPMISQKVLATPYIGSIVAKLLNIHLFSYGFSKIFGILTKPTSEDLLDFWKLIRNNDGYTILHLLLQYIDERHNNNKRWTEALQNTNIPIHIIFGDSDPINPKEFVDEMRRLVPKASIKILEEIGHYPQWEDPSNTFQSLVSFIDSISIK